MCALAVCCDDFKRGINEKSFAFAKLLYLLERETELESATLTMARLCSTN